MGRTTGRARPLGRDLECAHLDHLVEDVRRGVSRTLIVRGEPGVGKTTLLNYAVGRAPDATIARATGVESEMELAFAGLHQLCAPMLDDLAGLPAPQRSALESVFALTADAPAPPDRFLVGLAVLSLLSEKAEQCPLLCVVDDAHWLDHASALTLAFVSRRLMAERVGLLFGARTPWQELQDVPEMQVTGLGHSDACELLASAVGSRLDERVRDRIVAETRGNPLALLELPRGLTAAQLAGGFGLPDAYGLSGKIKGSFMRRLDALSHDARRLALLAAAEPVGDALPLWRAADALGIPPSVAEEAAIRELLEIREEVRFRHPLARSAAYQSASEGERRAAHRALANATDPTTDPDRRAWHLAAAAMGPDERVALELERSAERAHGRGGVAAAAAFLTRAAMLSEDGGRRADRSLSAAQASLQAGAFDDALGLLATAESGPLDEPQRARAELLRAQVGFASNRGSAAPALLLQAAKRAESHLPALARDGYLQAMSAAMFAARLAAPGGTAQDVAQAVRAAPPAVRASSVAGRLLDGWAALFAEGCAAATPALREALAQFVADIAAPEQLHLLWLVTITAPVVWDDARWDALSRYHVDVARNSGALSELPLALNSRSYIHLFRGELDTAASLIEQARISTEATGAGLTPWGALALAVLRGDEHDASAKLAVAAADASRRGEGIGLTVIAWARAMLHNIVGLPDEALAAAREAVACPTNSASTAWALVELVEAAAQRGDVDEARDSAAQFARIAEATASDWALGVSARLGALSCSDEAADDLYREAITRLGRCRMRLDLARTHLSYGEWLRRHARRLEAREHLRAAHDLFDEMGMDGFGTRARNELLASGERVRKRIPATGDGLTAQERQIAQLARDGLSNPEIGAHLLLSPRTVEWHLHKVFSKLGVVSRTDLRAALADRGSNADAA